MTTTTVNTTGTRITTDTARTARGAGLAYLSLAFTGGIGFLLVRPQLFTDSATETLANLTKHTDLAHFAVGLEMAAVIAQALTAVWFYRLFRDIRPVAAFAIATFGLLNSAALMASGAFMSTAVAVASDTSIINTADAAGTVGTLAQLSTGSWAMGNIFFGLWLVPMGWAALTTRRFPVPLGWLLVGGGVGYVLSGLLAQGIADAPAWAINGLVIPATVAEFWMIGYLLTIGIRPRHNRSHP